MRLNIADFLATGQFCGLSADTTSTEITSQCGEPTARSETQAKSSVWKYGRVQFFLLDGKLVQVLIYYQNMEDYGIAVEDPFVVKPTLAAFQQFLERHGVTYRVSQKLTFEDQLCLETEHRVQLLFRNGVCEKLGKVF
jgi:hypothetical protein